MVNFPTDRNVVVLASYRTGSTALCDIISKTVKAINLDEAFHFTKPVEWYDQYRQKRYVIKIMPDQFSHPRVTEVIDHAFVVGIWRRDICAQITSFYICHMTQNWHYYKGQKSQSYTVPIDQDQIENQVNWINTVNAQYRVLAQRHCQQQFVYEDLQQKFADSKFDQYHRPANYDKIYQTIHDLLQCTQ